MKIFFGNANFDPERWEGAATHITELIQELATLGAEVIVNGSSQVRNVPHYRSGRLQALLQLRDCDFAYYRFHGLIPEIQHPFEHRWARWLFQMPLVWEINSVTMVDGGPEDDLETPDVPELRRRYGEAAALVQAAICNTDGLAQFARDLGIPMVRKIPLGSNPSHFSRRTELPDVLQPLRRDLNVVWIGSAGMRWHDFHTIIQAARRLIHETRIRFFVIGSRPPLELPNNVFWLGHQSYWDMPKLLSGMDVGLAIYKEPRKSRYGVFSSPLKIFDYLACELAVVASPIEQVRGCIRHGENGFVVNFGDDSGIADTLRQILAEGDARRRWGLAGRQTVQQYYNWGRVATETLAFLDEIPREAKLHKTVRRKALSCGGVLADFLRRQFQNQHSLPLS